MVISNGHFNYAKSGRLYLQLMYVLHNEYPWLHDQFSNHGFHTVRRSNLLWAGLWTDLAIEQVLMRNIKNREGLTRGRGMSEAVRLLWIHSIHKCSEVHSAMGDITGTKHNTSEHVELGTSGIKRDNEDLTKILSWFTNFNPLDPNLRCLYSGLSSIVEKDNVNCEKLRQLEQQYS